MSIYNYQEGAIHKDNHKEITVNVSGKTDIVTLIKNFFAEDVEEVKEVEEIKDATESATTENSEQEPPPAQSPFTEEQIEASGIKIRPDIVLALMKEMQPQCKNKVDWLSFYTVLRHRQWVEENVRAFCRMVGELFGVNLDNSSLSRDLSKNGTDYTQWIENHKSILRRKRLAEEFDRRITEYFKRGRDEVLSTIR